MENFLELIDIVDKLRDPENGCPWDLKQTSKSLVPNMIEELYEVVEAIENNDPDHLKEELGDLLLHITMQVRIANEQGQFTYAEVLQSISEKLVRRHPHIFGDSEITDAAEVKLNWERLKKKEKEKKDRSIIDGIPKSMPALIIAWRMQEKASSAGFDWNEPEPVFDKIREETEELKEAVRNNSPEEIEEEIGDLLFSVVNLSRKLNIDSEFALKKSIAKFEYRFKLLEQYYKENNLDIYSASLEQMDEVWEKIKKRQ